MAIHVLFILIDIVFVLYIRRSIDLSDNKYFAFHKKYGFRKLNIVKVVIASFVSYPLLTHQIHAGGATLAIITAQSFWLTRLFRDYRKRKNA